VGAMTARCKGGGFGSPCTTPPSPQMQKRDRERTHNRFYIKPFMIIVRKDRVMRVQAAERGNGGMKDL